MKRYNSGISWGIILPLFGLLFVVEAMMLLSKAWASSALAALVIIFVTYLFRSTYYIITTDNYLIIKAGFIINKKIDIYTIKKITPSNNPIASPALSLKRLEIVYNKRDAVLISPEKKEEFIAHLKQINPAIFTKE